MTLPLRNGRVRGMVLFELLIALSIFCLVAFSLVLALDSAFDAARARNQLDLVVRGLNNHLILLRSAQVAPVDEDLPDDGTGVAYHVTIENEQLQDQKNQPIPNVYRATVTAKWKAGKDDVQRSVSELLYQP